MADKNENEMHCGVSPAVDLAFVMRSLLCSYYGKSLTSFTIFGNHIHNGDYMYGRIEKKKQRKLQFAFSKIEDKKVEKKCGPYKKYLSQPLLPAPHRTLYNWKKKET